MDIHQIRKFFIGVVLVVILLFAFFYLGGYTRDLISTTSSQLSSEQMATETLVGGTTLSQQFSVSGNMLTSVAFRTVGGDYAHFSYTIEGNGHTLVSGEIAQTVDNSMIELLPESLSISDLSTVTLNMTMLEGNHFLVFYGNQIELARGAVTISNLTAVNSLKINDRVLNGVFNLNITQQSIANISTALTVAFAVTIFILCVTLIFNLRRFQKGQYSYFVRVVTAVKKYLFVMQQLISRDFKAKYKRSVLGVLWSFLNPLLMMVIQYIVFSTIFKSTVANFPAYLISGTVCFAFFSEATSTGLLSISGNASLITKVYIPKYIFPISRVLSSGINFLLSLIPLMAVVIFSGLPITMAYFILPFVFLCMLELCIGMAMLLSAMMVFFRDIQFLWSVVTTLLMYATPIFYPESIIPAQFLLLYKANPLYHILRIFRAIVLDGAPPLPKAALICAGICTFILAIGAFTFKKQQDKFVLNL
jgi:ABC-2 type transport system permease protein